MRLVNALRGAALLAAFIAVPVRAGVFDDEEARARVDALKAEHTELAKRVDGINRNQVDFANQVEALKADLAKLRGQIEVLTYELEAAQKRQKDFYVDLDNRLRKMETAAAEAKAAAEPPKPDPQLETRDYEAALASLKALKYKEAGDAFLAFIAAYPAGTLTASAHYWGGYAHAQAKNHTKAAELFGKFAASWPEDERTPGALESRIASLEALKDAKAVRATLELLVDKYPTTPAGKRALLRLRKR